MTSGNQVYIYHRLFKERLKAINGILPLEESIDFY